ncbi:MAG TPA: hypothetical protein PKV73_16635 [Agriterribacter sp.]|nr:hypothetical protein [Agriterribacter sp.]
MSNTLSKEDENELKAYMDEYHKHAVATEIAKLEQYIAYKAQQEAIGFHRWAHENHYSIYWGSDGPNCDKWYKGYTPPDRKYYTDEELYNLYIKSKENGKN